MALKRIWLGAIALAVAACSGSTGPNARTGIFFVAGNKQTDTVLGTLPQKLLVRIAGTNVQSPAGHNVRFISVPDTNASEGYQVYLGPTNLGFSLGQTEWDDSTNAAGEASVTVTLGAQAGTAHLLIDVPDLQLIDTATFTVLAGSAFYVKATPTDTVVFNGSSFAYNAMTTDRYGNPRHDSLTFNVDSGPVTMSGATVTTTGPGFSTITIVAPKPGLGLNTTVTVVPHGTLATSNGQVITVFNTDGSNMHTITPTAPPGMIKWDPTGTHLVFDQHTRCATIQGVEIRTTDLTGATKTVDSNNVAYDEFPTYSRDGTWIYYSRNTGGSSAIWRVHPDGTSDDSLATTMPFFDIYPSPSPDGSKVAYVADHGADSTDLRILTVSTGAVTSYGVDAWSPEWSPSGNQIAYIAFIPTIDCAGPILLINADGSGRRSLTSASYFEGFDWSPDGQWIAATNSTTNLVELVNATTGQTITLPFASSQYSPAWQPGQPSAARFRHVAATARPLDRAGRARGVPR